MNAVAKYRARDIAREVLGPLLEKCVPFYLGVRKYPPGPSPIPSSQRNHQLPFPIDVVYTWVDGDDPNWLENKSRYAPDSVDSTTHFDAVHSSRFHDRDELRFSLRSLERFADFVRNIYIVTDDQVPDWLDIDHPRIRLVDHRQFFQSTRALPTFNSHAIGAQLHHIDGLAEHYLYLNDDFFFGQPASALDYFTADGKAVYYLSIEKVDTAPAHDRSGSVTWAAQNNRKLIERMFNKPLEHKILHVPYSQRRSLLYELETACPAEFDRTAHNRFRDKTDIKVPCSLLPYFAYYSDQAIFRTESEYPGMNKYINVASPFLRPVLRLILLSRGYRTFCLNEPVSSDLDTSIFDDLVNRFLEQYFPARSQFELA